MKSLSSHAWGRALLLCATLFQIACSGVTTQPERSEEGAGQGSTDIVASGSAQRFSIAAVGDIMLGTDYPSDRLAEDSYALLASVAPVLQLADVTFGNVEGVLMDGGEARKRCTNTSRCYVFRSPASYAETLSRAGFDVVSLANNHARDFGEEGRDATMQALDGVGIYHSGRTGDIAYWEQDGLRLAMIAFAPFGGSHDMLDMDGGRELINGVSSKSDILIVSFHGGAEGADATRVPFAMETFHGEQRGDVVAFARMAVEAGADLVVGHGPHVPRALELYRGRLIAYSLGNFATHWGINVRENNGVAPILLVTMNGDGDFIEGRIHSNRQQRPVGPQPDPQHQAARLIRELTLLDFPATPLTIDDEGYIKPSPAASTSLGASP
ncbi:MAG: CapA family protein [Chromatiales bacterium]|nr:CapA family protein [Chromatiales bacterium]